MKFFVAFAAVVVVVASQSSSSGGPLRYSLKPSLQAFNPTPRPYNPTIQPFKPTPQAFSPTPRPYNPTPRPYNPAPRPSAPVVNRVSTNDRTANLIRYENNIGPDGSYSYAFEIDNGIAAQAQGTPRALGGNPPEAPVVSQGSFSWTSPEGQPIVISYISDENGYQPTGDAIPTAHPIPEAILRSLEYNARNPQKN